MSVINIFGWHSHFGKSPRPSAIKAFVDPIKKYKKVNTIPLGQTSYHNFNYDSLIGQPIVFWGILPNLKLLEDKKSKIVLYVYDSILIDFAVEDGKETLQSIKSIVSSDFPIKIKKGYTYSSLEDI